MSEIFYPVERLLANPRVFFAVANALGGPDGETLKECFYELLEYGFSEATDSSEIVFEATEVCFRIDPDGEVEVVLDSGVASKLSPIEGEFRSMITNDMEMSATSVIYSRIVSAIEEANPEFAGNIALCSPPTPGNSYLRSEDGERFEGSFHLLSNPDLEYSFNVDIIDVERDILKATYKPLR